MSDVFSAGVRPGGLRSAEEIKVLLHNAVDACFADADVKAWLRDKIG